MAETGLVGGKLHPHMTGMKLSVLDQSPIRRGHEPAASIRESVALAQACERFGYARYWVSEHHNSGSIAGTAPEILIAAIAARTRTIRVGSAGVMLPHYASLKVAEQFRVLDALTPGRIDLGLGRAPGSDMATAMALNVGVRENAEHFLVHVQEVLALLEGQALATSHPNHAIVAEPRGATTPETWLLGSSAWGAQAAAFLGLPYCFAWFFSDGQGAEEAMHLYRTNFRPSRTLDAPHAAITVFAVAADTEAEAWRENRTRENWRLDLERGMFLPLVPPEDAAARVLTPVEEARIGRMRERAIVGTGEQVVERIDALARSLGADEVAVVTATYGAEPRVRSYELVARAAGLEEGQGSALDPLGS